MFEPTEYQLLDFGDGRKLERFGAIVVDRPSPAASGTQRAQPKLWAQAHGTYIQSRKGRTDGRWQWHGKPPAEWHLHHGNLAFALRPAAGGQLGVFPEQAVNWDWIQRRLPPSGEPCRVLNGFAYTGGSTLAAAAADANVVHLDAARSAVQWARGNAELSKLQDRAIRWIVEDARRFIARELRRRRTYDALILDPPTYGHGTRGEAWQIQRDLPLLLRDCGQLVDSACRFVLVSWHTPQITSTIVELLERAFVDKLGGRVTHQQLSLLAGDGRQLPSGEAAYWEPAC